MNLQTGNRGKQMMKSEGTGGTGDVVFDVVRGFVGSAADDNIRCNFQKSGT